MKIAQIREKRLQGSKAQFLLRRISKELKTCRKQQNIKKKKIFIFEAKLWI